MARDEALAVGMTAFARMASLHPNTVAELLDAGEIPELTRLGRSRRIPSWWVDWWLKTIINQPSTDDQHGGSNADDAPDYAEDHRVH